MLVIPKRKENIMYFDNDDEFYNWCVVPELIVKDSTLPDGSVRSYTDFEFSNNYNDAVNNGTVFVIKDEDSNICKNKAVSYRTITKPIQNMEMYHPWIHKCNECGDK